MPVSLSRLRISADLDDGRGLLSVLVAIAGTAPPPTDTKAATVKIGTTEIEVAVGRPAAATVIELATDRPLAEVLDDVVAVHGSASSAPSDPDAPIEAVTAHVGEVSVRVTTDVALATQLAAVLADAEAREDRAGAAWARHSLGHVEKVIAQAQAVEDLLLALIPTRERGALTALVIAQAMPRIAAAVDAAVAEAKRISAEVREADQAHRTEREADRG